MTRCKEGCIMCWPPRPVPKPTPPARPCRHPKGTRIQAGWLCGRMQRWCSICGSLRVGGRWRYPKEPK